MAPPAASQAQASTPQDAAGFNPSDDTLNYERYQNPELYEPQLHSLQEFINEQDNTSPIGVEVREDQRKLEGGTEATGLLIIGVTPGSPAAKAGLHAHTDTARNVLEGAAVAGAMVFPPAVLFIPILANVPIGDNYDLIIAVDGWRVMNFVEFEDRMRDVQPGEIVYLTVVRNGKRLQVAVQVPQDQAAVAPGF
ncbi:MAG: PDZ domain-containing protein [Candidatus Binataceae bacterium]